MWRHILAALVALLIGGQAVAQTYPSEQLRLPPVRSQYFRFAGDVDRPEVLAGYLLEAIPRAPYLAECYGTLYDLALWQDERQDCPASLRDPATGLRKAGNTFWLTTERRGRIELNAQYNVRATLGHELGHTVQHWSRTLPPGHPGGDTAGRLMWSTWSSLPGPDDEEAFAEAFRAHLQDAPSPFFRWFPAVLKLWQPRAVYIWDPVYVDGFWQWWDSGRVQLERYQDGRHLFWDGYRWTEV